MPLDLRYLNEVNKTELVQLCNLLHPKLRAHHGIPIEQLREIIKGGTHEKFVNSVDRYRNFIKEFLAVYWSKVKDQFEPTCNGECYKCSDMVVLSCYVVNYKKLRAFRSKKTKEE